MRRAERDTARTDRPTALAERGTVIVFAVSGAVHASWMSRLPALATNLHLDLALVGFALFALGTGSLISMPATGRLCRRFGSRRVVGVATLLTCAALAGLGWVNTAVELRLVLLCFGLGSGAWGRGNEPARRRGRGGHQQAPDADVPRFLECGQRGGRRVALAARVPLATSTHFTAAGLAGAGLCWLGARAFVDERRLPPVPHPSARVVALRRLLLLGLLMVCGATIEGAAGDWLAIYLAGTRRASHARAAVGYTLFLTASAIGRFLAGAVQARIGRARTIQLGAGLAAGGIVVSVLTSLPVLDYVGVLRWGLGICVVFPAVLSAGGRSGAGDGTAVLTTVGYVAAFVAPPLIGTGGERVGLGYALLVLPVLAVGVIVLAPVLDRGPGAAVS